MQANQRRLEMGDVFHCIRCGEKRGCNPTGEFGDYQDCGDCEFRNGCISTVGYKRQDGGECFQCRVKNPPLAFFFSGDISQ